MEGVMGGGDATGELEVTGGARHLSGKRGDNTHQLSPPPSPVHPGMSSPFERWKHKRPVAQSTSSSHSPMQAWRLPSTVFLPRFEPDSLVSAASVTDILLLSSARVD